MKEGSGLKEFSVLCVSMWLPALHNAQNTYLNAHLAGFQFHVAGVWLPALHNAQVQGRAAAGHAADCFLCAGDPHSLQGEGSVQAVGWSGLM